MLLPGSVLSWYHIGLSLQSKGRFSWNCFTHPVYHAVYRAALARFCPMDLYKAIQELYAEKEKLERVIASLEELQRTAGSLTEVPEKGARRGRKSMSSEEREVVSERMKRYWATRRNNGKHLAEGQS